MSQVADVQELMECVPCKVQLPNDWIDFFEHAGPVPTSFSDRRQVPRFYARTRAILKSHRTIPSLDRAESSSQVYAKDISRTGICLITGEQFYPREELSLLLADGKLRELRVVRCRRIQNQCYEVACQFVF